MTERERLIDLLAECRGIEGIGMELLEKQADHLIANGVIVPPCKVGERLPTKEENEIGLVGIVNGYNGKIRFEDAIIFVNYDFDEKSVVFVGL